MSVHDDQQPRFEIVDRDVFLAGHTDGSWYRITSG
jgi:hypothetical protein